MASLVPVARWFGFGFGYSVAEAVALTAVGWYAGPFAVVMVMHVMNITFLFIGGYALVRTLFLAWRAKRVPLAEGLGTYANSDSHEGGRVSDRPHGLA